MDSIYIQDIIKYSKYLNELKNVYYDLQELSRDINGLKDEYRKSCDAHFKNGVIQFIYLILGILIIKMDQKKIRQVMYLH